MTVYKQPGQTVIVHENCDDCMEMAHAFGGQKFRCLRHHHAPLLPMTKAPMDTTWFLASKDHTPYVIRSFDHYNDLCDCEWVTPDGQTKYHWDTFDGWLPLPKAMCPNQED